MTVSADCPVWLQPGNILKKIAFVLYDVHHKIYECLQKQYLDMIKVV